MFQKCAFILLRGDLWKLSCLLLPTHETISWDWSDSPNNAMCAQHTKVLRTYEACSGARWAALRGSLSWWTLCAALSRAASLRQWGQRRLHRRTRMLAGKRMGVGTAAAFTALHLLPFVSGHGRLMDPPARNSMWRWKRNCKIGRKKNAPLSGLGSSTQSTTTIMRSSVEEWATSLKRMVEGILFFSHA